MRSARHYDVAVVGAGPVGLGLAIELGQRGHSVAVAERTSTLHAMPKGQNLTQRTMEHFHFWGCEDRIRAARIVPRDYAIGGMTSYRTLLSGHHYDWLQRDLVRPYYFTDNERLPQFRTEAAMRARAAEVPSIHVGYGLTCTGVRQLPDSATVDLTDADGVAQSITASFVVGADGSHSIVRRAAGIGQTRSAHDMRMVLIVFRSTGLHDLLKRYPGKQFYCVLDRELQGYWLFFGRVDLGTTWFFHAPVPADTTRDNFDFRAYVERAVGASIDFEPEHIGFWDLRFAVADTYRTGRIFVAGDAAHSHPPYGGYGVNTGLEDARNLGWKLSAHLEGWAGDGLLDSYNEERKPVFETTARHFIERFIREDRDFLNAHSPEEDGEDAFRRVWENRNEGSSEVMSFAPNYDGSSIVFGNGSAAPSALGTHEAVARPGHHLTPMEIAGGRNAYDLLGRGFTLFAHAGRSAAARAFRDAADALKVPLRTELCSEGEAFSRWQAEMVLVRPDNYVAWTGSGETVEATGILSRSVGGGRGGAGRA